MRGYEANLSSFLKGGLRRQQVVAADVPCLVACFNFMPTVEGTLEYHESVKTADSSDLVGSHVQAASAGGTRTIYIKAYDWLDRTTYLDGVAVYLDSVYKGLIDASTKQLEITGVSQGTHTIKMTKTGEYQCKILYGGSWYYTDANGEVDIPMSGDVLLTIYHLDGTIASDVHVFFDGTFQGTSSTYGYIQAADMDATVTVKTLYQDLIASDSDLLVNEEIFVL